jgi:hypothetical protein
MGGDLMTDDELDAEARAFARYLVRRTPPPELVVRYREASRVLFSAPTDPADAAVVRFAVRHPWSVGLLDAAAGFRRPGGLLRSKLLVTSAILEASPTFADEFLPRSVGALRLAGTIAAAGTLAVLRLLLGVPLHALAARA